MNPRCCLNDSMMEHVSLFHSFCNSLTNTTAMASKATTAGTADRIPNVMKLGLGALQRSRVCDGTIARFPGVLQLKRQLPKKLKPLKQQRERQRQVDVQHTCTYNTCTYTYVNFNMFTYFMCTWPFCSVHTFSKWKSSKWWRVRQGEFIIL